MSKLRGHDIETQNGVWVYSDTKERVQDTWKQRPCGKCDKEFTPEGHDPCLGTLEGVSNACCGHGHDEPYVQFEDGKRVIGDKALEIFEKLKT